MKDATIYELLETADFTRAQRLTEALVEVLNRELDLQRHEGGVSAAHLMVGFLCALKSMETHMPATKPAPLQALLENADRVIAELSVLIAKGAGKSQ